MNFTPASNKDGNGTQQLHWVQAFSQKPEMFGLFPSEPAKKAAELFGKESKAKILELGAGQGRDTIYFARCGFRVYALDYAANGLAAIVQRARQLDVIDSVTTLHHDVRQGLPFEQGSFDGCFSHMLFCMEFTVKELESLAREVNRVLTPGGTFIYTVRHTGDPHYGKGLPHGEDMYETNGFVVHFFDRPKVERLAVGCDLTGIEEFEEGSLPRKLFRVTLRKST